MVEQSRDSVLGWNRFFTELETFLITANREIDSANNNYAQFVIERFDICLHVLSSLHTQLEDVESNDPDIVETSAMLADVRDSCALLQTIWYRRLDQLDAHIENNEGYRAPQIAGRAGRGRPQFLISQDQLEYLQSLNFTWSEIGHMLGVSRMTIYRRRRDFGILDIRSNLKTISDADLRTYLSQLRQDMPNMGETLVIGRIRSLGYAVTRQRLRDAIHATDPLNTSLRWRGILAARRPYSVPSPNSLWHQGIY